MFEYAYQVVCEYDYTIEPVGNVWAPNAKEAIKRAKKQFGYAAGKGGKFEASRYDNQQREVGGSGLRARYAAALQENARLKSPKRAAFGPVRQAKKSSYKAKKNAGNFARRGTGHIHPPGPRRCPKCGV